MKPNLVIVLIGSVFAGKRTTLVALKDSLGLGGELIGSVLPDTPEIAMFPPGLKILALDLRPAGVSCVIATAMGPAPHEYTLWFASRANVVVYVWRGTSEDDAPYNDWVLRVDRKSGTTRSLFDQSGDSTPRPGRTVYHQLNGCDELDEGKRRRLAEEIQALTGSSPLLTAASLGQMGGLDVALKEIILARS